MSQAVKVLHFSGKFFMLWVGAAGGAPSPDWLRSLVTPGVFLGVSQYMDEGDQVLRVRGGICCSCEYRSHPAVPPGAQMLGEGKQQGRVHLKSNMSHFCP